MVARAEAGAALQQPGTELGIRCFVAEVWPGETVTDRDLRRLAALAGLSGETEEPPDAAEAAERSRIECALRVARMSGHAELRRWAWRGWLRPAAAARPGQPAWSLAVAPLLSEPLELWLAPRVERIADALAELWPAGDQPVLVLREWPAWLRGERNRRRAAAVRWRLATALERRAAARGWAGAIEVLVAAE
ncbi:MAG: hypothetical protein N2652_03850 [Kiritimatiellae bacterium]|nr:hypothetical protein [Kiritimatiellia bacterium]